MAFLLIKFVFCVYDICAPLNRLSIMAYKRYISYKEELQMLDAE